MSSRTTPNDSDNGFTLVEILIAIVLVGILSVVVIVGISNLTDSGSKSACTASRDAAKAGAVTYYASHNNTYPVNFTEMTAGNSPALVLPSEAKINAVDATDPVAKAGMQVQAGSWQLTMTAGANGAAPTFTCTP